MADTDTAGLSLQPTKPGSKGTNEVHHWARGT